MKKKYFAKYLPVKGKMENGDKCWHPHEGMHNYMDVACESSDCQKVKLFLCNRDIQVGDKMWSSIYGGLKEYTRTKSMDFECSPPSYSGELDATAFKVIGEISPEATFVKEGDEFEEDQIKIFTDYPHTLIERTIIQIKGPCGHYH